MNTDKKLMVAFAVVAVGLILYPPTLLWVGARPSISHDHIALWNIGAVQDKEPQTIGEAMLYRPSVRTTVDYGRLALYQLALAIAAGVTYFIRKK